MLKVGIVIGTNPHGLLQPKGIFRLAQQTEELGFDSITTGDHIVTRVPMLEPFTYLGALSACTSRIALATSVMLLPLRNPGVVAKSVASLDYLSGGRVIFGVGVGGEFAREFELCGIPLKERGRRTDEAIEIIRKLWTQDRAEHHGRFWQFRGASISPKPVQPSGPPIWVGGRSDAALRRAALLCDGWIAYLTDPERFGASSEKIRAIAADAGRDLSSFTFAQQVFTRLDVDKDHARQKAVPFLSTIYGQKFDNLVDRFCALGTAQDCADWLRRYVERGAQHIVLAPMCAPEELPDQIAAYAKEIVPLLRD